MSGGYIRELRNEIAHDYPLMENDIVSVLNELISKVSILKSIYKRMKAAVLKEKIVRFNKKRNLEKNVPHLNYHIWMRDVLSFVF